MYTVLYLCLTTTVSIHKEFRESKYSSVVFPGPVGQYMFSEASLLKEFDMSFS